MLGRPGDSIVVGFGIEVAAEKGLGTAVGLHMRLKARPVMVEAVDTAAAAVVAERMRECSTN